MLAPRLKIAVPCLCLLSLCSVDPSHGKDHAFHLGIVADAGVKYELFSSGGARYALWGRAGAGFSLLIAGQDEYALSVMPQVTFARDHAQYQLSHGNNFGIERYLLACNAAVLFPTKLERLKVTAGFGLEWTMSGGLYIRSTDSYSGYGNNDLDAAAAIIERVERKLIPTIAAGCQYAIGNGLQCQVFLKQAMLNAYPGSPKVYLGLNSSGTELHHQPLYLGVSCGFYFNRKS